jgi:FMNH2-dependent dimethyl sulfone monooxygenase
VAQLGSPIVIAQEVEMIETALHYAGDDEPLRFAYWVPAISTGYLASRIQQQFGWDLEYNVKLAKIAEEAGIDYGLTATRFNATYSDDGQHEAVTLSQFILARTNKLRLISAVLTGLWQPGVMAKIGSTADVLSDGRWAINIVSGWHRGQYRSFGQPWLEHDERYRQSEEFIQVLKGCWSGEEFSFKGDFFRINYYQLSPRPVQRPHPEIFQGGSSTAARKMAGRWSDWYFTNGGKPSEIKPQVDEVLGYAAEHRRRVRIGVNSFVIARETEREARSAYDEIIRLADWDAVNRFAKEVKEAGRSTTDGIGNWAKSSLVDLVQGNDGFKTDLIGTPEQIAERILALKNVGVGLILMGFLNFHEEVAHFGKHILPLVREMEAERARRRLSA